MLWEWIILFLCSFIHVFVSVNIFLDFVSEFIEIDKLGNSINKDKVYNVEENYNSKKSYFWGLFFLLFKIVLFFIFNLFMFDLYEFRINTMITDNNIDVNNNLKIFLIKGFFFFLKILLIYFFDFAFIFTIIAYKIYIKNLILKREIDINIRDKNEIFDFLMIE